MVFDFNEEKKVKITMYQYLDNVIEGAPVSYKVISSEAGVGMATPTPTPINLYEVRDPSKERVELLSEKEREEYHTFTDQLLYARGVDLNSRPPSRFTVLEYKGLTQTIRRS